MESRAVFLIISMFFYNKKPKKYSILLMIDNYINGDTYRNILNERYSGEISKHTLLFLNEKYTYVIFSSFTYIVL